MVKASTWEGPFMRRIGAVRAQELSQLQVALLMQVRGVWVSVWEGVQACACVHER